MNSQRIWGLALGISLSLNAFCLAALLTGWFGSGPAHHDPGQHLPPQARELFRELAPFRQAGVREAMQTIRQQRQGVRAALTAEPYDPDELAAAFARLREAETTAALRAHQHISRVAATLSAQDRKQLARFVGRRQGPRGAGQRMPPPEH